MNKEDNKGRRGKKPFFYVNESRLEVLRWFHFFWEKDF